MFRLSSHPMEVSPAAQFEDVGFVSHLKDPDGLVIELLQHTFGGEGKFEPSKDLLKEEEPLGQLFSVGQVQLLFFDFFYVY